MTHVRISLIAILLLTLGVILGYAQAADAIAVVTANFTARPTSIEASVTADENADMSWCVAGWELKKYYPSANPPPADLGRSNCLAPYSLDNGWILVTPPAGSPGMTFTIPHLPPNLTTTVKLHIADHAFPPDFTNTQYNVGLPDKLRFTTGPTLGNSRYEAGEYRADIEWDTSSPADTRIQYAPRSALTWRTSSAGANTLRSVAVGQNSVAVAVGDSGLVMRSTDSGQTWAVIPSFTSQNFTSVAASDLYTFWAVAWGGRIYFSSNSGLNWSSLSDPMLLNGVDAPTPDSAVVVGANGLVMVTTDQGSVWDTLPAPGANHLLRVDASSPDAMWVAGESGLVARTTDRGASWTVRTPIIETITAIAGVNATTAYFSTVGGRVYRTLDNGNTWTQVYAVGGSGLNTLITAPSGEVWTFDSNFKVHYFDGSAWSMLNDVLIPSTPMYGSALGSSVNFFAVGGSQTILNRYVNYCGSGVCATPDASLTTGHLSGGNPVVMGPLSCAQRNYYARARSRDAAGQILSDTDQPFATIDCVDSVPPVIQISPALPLYTNQAILSVTGTVSDDVGVVRLGFAAAPSTAPPPVPNSPPVPAVPLPTAPGVTVNWTYPAPLVANVENKVYAHAEDATPNVDDDFGLVTYDSIPPTITVIQPATPPATVIYTDVNPVMKATVVDNFGVVGVLMKNQTNGIDYPAALSGGEWSATVGLNPGPNRVVVVATDVAGNIRIEPAGPAAYTFIKDAAPPTVTISTPVEMACFGDGNQIDVTGTWDDDSGVIAGVELDPGDGVFVPTTLFGVKQWKTKIDLSQDVTNIRARVTDMTGQTGFSVIRKLQLDTHDPTAAITSHAEGAVVDISPITLAGTVDDTQGGAVYSCGIDRVQIFDKDGFHDAADFSWRGPAALSTTAPTELYVRVTDKATRIAESAKIHVTLADAPELGFDAGNPPSPTSISPVVINGWARDRGRMDHLEALHIETGEVLPVTITAEISPQPADLRWQISVLNPVEGNNNVQITAVNVISKSTRITGSFTYIVPDTTPPNIENATATPFIQCPAEIPSIVFAWDTAEASKTKIEYGFLTTPAATPVPPAVPNYERLFEDTTLRNSHGYIADTFIQRNTIYYYRLTSEDAAGNADSVTGRVLTPAGCDSNPPIVTFGFIDDDPPVSGTQTVTATGFDPEIKVVAMTLFIDGVQQGAPYTCPAHPCVVNYSWNTAEYFNSPPPHEIRATAEDVSGNIGENSINVSTFNDISAPIVTNVRDNAEANCDGSAPCDVQIAWCTDEVSSSKVDYGIETDPARGIYTYDQVQSGDDCLPVGGCTVGHCVTLRGLTENRRYHYRVESEDAYGNKGH